MQIKLSMSFISLRLVLCVSLGPFRAAVTVAPATLAVEQASALLRCCCPSMGLVWVLAVFSAAGMVAKGPGAGCGGRKLGCWSSGCGHSQEG